MATLTALPPSSEQLSFEHHIRHASTAILTRLDDGDKSLDGILELLRLRIDAERQFTHSLQHILSESVKLISRTDGTETLRSDGLDAICSDIKNEYLQRKEFLNTLQNDLYESCIKMKEQYVTKNKLYINETKNNIKLIKQKQNEFNKIKIKYEQIMNKRKPKKQQIIIHKKKYDQQRSIWINHQQQFDNKMTTILQCIQLNEYKRMNSMKDILTNWAAFTTNLCANRSYDIRNLAQSMSLIDIDTDLQCFMKLTLLRYPKSADIDNIKSNNIYFILPKQSAPDYISESYLKQRRNENKLKKKNYRYQSIKIKSMDDDISVYGVSQKRNRSRSAF